MLIDAGASLQARNNATGCVPLHDAARCGHLGAVRALLDHGAPHMPRNSSGELPVDLAREFGHAECARYLEAHEPLAAATFEHQWFHGTMERPESTALLRQHVQALQAGETDATDEGAGGGGGGAESEAADCGSGVFLVRNSANSGDLVLALLFENQPKNFIIQKYVSILTKNAVYCRFTNLIESCSLVEMPLHRRGPLHAQPASSHPALPAF